MGGHRTEIAACFCIPATGQPLVNYWSNTGQTACCFTQVELPKIDGQGEGRGATGQILVKQSFVDELSGRARGGGVIGCAPGPPAIFCSSLFRSDLLLRSCPSGEEKRILEPGPPGPEFVRRRSGPQAQTQGEEGGRVLAKQAVECWMDAGGGQAKGGVAESTSGEGRD
jgi:hypothetical protein